MQDQRMSLFELIKLLDADFMLSIDKVKSAVPNDVGFYKRSFVRSMASWIEGNLFIHKKIISDFDGQWHQSLNLEYQLYLFESDWTISDSGKSVLKSKKLGTLQNLKGFLVFSEELFPGYSIDFGVSGWESVRTFFKLRDGMMHPSTSSQLEFSADQMDKFDEAASWIKSEFRRVRNAMTEELKMYKQNPTP